MQRKWWAVAGFLFLAFSALVGIGLGIAWVMNVLENIAEVSLPVLLVIGVSTLILVLAAVAAIFAALNLSDKQQALGLPEGSVRAAIALSLILIFTIMSVFLYQQIDNRFYTSAGITEDMLNDIPSSEIVAIKTHTDATGVNTYDITRKVVASNPDSVDLAKQVLTTTSTLVVAVAGFYFGTKAVSTAREVTERKQPTIRSINPVSITQPTKGNLDFEIRGKNFDRPIIVSLKKDARTIKGEDIVSSETSIKCKFNFENALTKEDIGTWMLYVANKNGEEDKLEDAFEIKAVSPQVAVQTGNEEEKG